MPGISNRSGTLSAIPESVDNTHPEFSQMIPVPQCQSLISSAGGKCGIRIRFFLLHPGITSRYNIAGNNTDSVTHLGKYSPK